MNDAFFPNLSREQIMKLGQNGIGNSHFRTNGYDGILVRGAEIARALEALGLDVVDKRRSSYEGLDILTLGKKKVSKNKETAMPKEKTVATAGPAYDPNSPLPKLRLQLPNPDAYDSQCVELDKVFTDATREILLPALRGKFEQVTLVGKSGYGTYLNRLQDRPNHFRIFLYDAPVFPGKKAESLETASACEIDGVNYYRFKNSGIGTPIKVNNFIVAEIIENNLFVLTKSYNRSSLSLYEAILLEAVKILLTDREYAVYEKSVPKHLPITIHNWGDRYNRQGFMKLLREKIPALAGDKVEQIKVRCADFEVKIPKTIDSTVFNVYLYCTTNRPNYINAPDKLLDLVNHDGRYAAPPVDQGLMLCDETSDYVIAELIDNNLFVYHNIFASDSKNSLEIFAKIVEELLRIKDTPQDELKKLRYERMRTRYMEECKRRLGSRTQTVRKQKASLDSTIEKLRKDLIVAIREQEECQAELIGLESYEGGYLKKFGEEYDRLIKLDKVIDIKIDSKNGKLLVYTENLYCRHPRSHALHDIGKFRIEISTTGDHDGIRWFNLTRQVNGHNSGMNAPHIYHDGHACLGSAAEILPELIAKYEFAAVILVAIQFVESVNINDSAGQHISNWPVVKKTTKEVTV